MTPGKNPASASPSRKRAAMNAVGLSIAPILFGPLMDRGMFAAVLCGVALFQGLAVVAALGVGQARIATAAVPAVQPQPRV